MIARQPQMAFESLAQAITAAGESMWVDGTVIMASDAAAVQAIIDAFPLASAKAEVCARIDRLAKAKRDAIVADFSPAEMASWPIKREEARQYVGIDANVPTLAAEAVARGVGTQVIVDKVLAKSATLLALEAQIAGTNGRHADAINALETFDAVALYDFATGWPV